MATERYYKSRQVNSIITVNNSDLGLDIHPRLSTEQFYYMKQSFELAFSKTGYISLIRYSVAIEASTIAGLTSATNEG